MHRNGWYRCAAPLQSLARVHDALSNWRNTTCVQLLSLGPRGQTESAANLSLNQRLKFTSCQVKKPLGQPCLLSCALICATLLIPYSLQVIHRQVEQRMAGIAV